MAKYILTKTDKYRINFFIIRETYNYMAKIDKIGNAMSRFYKYLEIDSNNYDKIIEVGICSSSENGKMKTCVEKLIKCGFSDTLFRKDSPTLIKTSELLLDDICDYLFTKRMSLEEFRRNLSMDLGTIMNTDDTLLVVATRKLINDMVSASEPDDSLMDFMNLLEEYEFKGHNLQKEIVPNVLEFYNEYKKAKEQKEK